MDLIAVDVRFNSPFKCAVGFGGQGNTDYSHCDYLTLNHRILIEPNNTLPIVIDSTYSGEHFIWQFDTNYFTIDEGFAPRALDWNQLNSGSMIEHQEFQISNQEWVFKKGDASYENSGLTNLIQTFELIDLTIFPDPNISIMISGDSITLSWPTYCQAGFKVQSADSLDGLWTPLQFETNSAATNSVVIISTNKTAQFYRLRK